jgi:hypothetical protein
MFSFFIVVAARADLQDDERRARHGDRPVGVGRHVDHVTAGAMDPCGRLCTGVGRIEGAVVLRPEVEVLVDLGISTGRRNARHGPQVVGMEPDVRALEVRGLARWTRRRRVCRRPVRVDAAVGRVQRRAGVDRCLRVER